MNQQTAETLADPRWFPIRFNIASDEFHFKFISGEIHRAVAFLTDIDSADEVRVIPRAAIRDIPVETAPLHMILHSGFGGSTLLARALAQPGVVTTLKEPPILTDVIAHSLRNPAEDSGQLLEDVTRLLSRPLSPGEAIVCKMSNIGNGLVGRMAAHDPRSRILCLQNPLDQMLASLASKGIEGRLGARRLFVGLYNSRMSCVELTDRQLRESIDFQFAALAWLSLQKMIGDAAKKFGPERVRSMTSEQLLGQTPESLRAIAGHFQLSLDVEGRLASGIFERHAKTGEPFNSSERAQRLSETLRVHRMEIDPVVSWASKVAETAGVAWDLPYPLMS